MKSPLEIYGQLFIDLHLSDIWADGKFISDAIPLYEPKEIITKYNALKETAGFNLEHFFNQHFQNGQKDSSEFVTNKEHTIDEHIRHLWKNLKREKDKKMPGDTLVALPHPYIVPGGRFNEIYYWDSYFTMLGLKLHGEVEIIHSMVKNFAYLIDNIGFIPNGNKTYFLSRSQPPFFSLMVQLLAEIQGKNIYSDFYPMMKKEYEFWMDPEQGHYNEDLGLNRYFDKKDEPREEMYGHDAKMDVQADQYQHMRAACESGWDFSSRWFSDPMDIKTINALNIYPVDLHCLLYLVEKLLAESASVLGMQEEAKYYLGQAQKRRKLTDQYFWKEENGFYYDYWEGGQEIGRSKGRETLAGIFPLYSGIANESQVKKVRGILKIEFLRDGGLVTTLIESGQQWDAPNGWPPLQWICYEGLRRNGEEDLANEIASRWCDLCENVFKNTGKMMEKYNVEDLSLLSGGGEYPVQDGFGWANGVFVALKNEIDKSNYSS